MPRRVAGKWEPGCTQPLSPPQLVTLEQGQPGIILHNLQTMLRGCALLVKLTAKYLSLHSQFLSPDLFCLTSPKLTLATMPTTTTSYLYQ